MVAVYYGRHDDPMGINLKRGIAAAFQASFSTKDGSEGENEEEEEEEVEEEEEDIYSKHISFVIGISF